MSYYVGYGVELVSQWLPNLLKVVSTKNMSQYEVIHIQLFVLYCIVVHRNVIGRSDIGCGWSQGEDYAANNVRCASSSVWH